MLGFLKSFINGLSCVTSNLVLDALAKARMERSSLLDLKSILLLFSFSSACSNFSEGIIFMIFLFLYLIKSRVKSRFSVYSPQKLLFSGGEINFIFYSLYVALVVSYPQSR